MIGRKFLAAALAAAIVIPASAMAESGTGTVTYVNIWSEKTPRPGGGSVARSYSRGVILADDPATPFHLASQDCRGTTVHSADGAPVDGSGYCDSVDRDGDTWSLWYVTQGAGSAWTIIGGTGKYAAMTGGGTTESLLNSEDRRAVIRWEGTW